MTATLKFNEAADSFRRHIETGGTLPAHLMTGTRYSSSDAVCLRRYIHEIKPDVTVTRAEDGWGFIVDTYNNATCQDCGQPYHRNGRESRCPACLPAWNETKRARHNRKSNAARKVRRAAVEKTGRKGPTAKTLECHRHGVYLSYWACDPCPVCMTPYRTKVAPPKNLELVGDLVLAAYGG